MTTSAFIPAIAIATLAIASLVRAETVLPSAQSVYADFRARSVGDVLTILIVESTSASKSASTQTDADASSDVIGLGRLDFLDFWNLSADNSSEGGGTTRRQGNLTARITVNVIEIDPTGLLVVEGTRTVRVNGEVEEIVLRGKVRPQDVAPNNTVYSTFLADASIDFTGDGSLNNASEPGILTRILNWLF